ncbi:hypothetical protein ACJJTC_011107 [Scirpophaga incertulas]
MKRVRGLLSPHARLWVSTNTLQSSLSTPVTHRAPVYPCSCPSGVQFAADSWISWGLTLLTDQPLADGNYAAPRNPLLQVSSLLAPIAADFMGPHILNGPMNNLLQVATF